MTAMGTAVLAAYRAIKALHGVAITYTVPGTGEVNLTAVPGQSDQLSEQDGMVVSQYRTRDYLIEASELVIDGTPITPDRFHTITEGTLTHKVLLEGGSAAWRYTDHTKQVIRVSTKETA